MKPEPIDAAKLALRTLRVLDDGRRAVQDGWARLTGQPSQQTAKPSADPRKPPEVW